MKFLFAVVMAAGMLLAPASQAVVIRFEAILDGASEVPPNGSPATGFVNALLDTTAHTLTIDAVFSGLTAGNTAAHIHCCFSTAPGTFVVATTTPTFAGFPTGATSGTFHTVLDLTDAASYRAGFITSAGGTVAGAEAALTAGLISETSYFNIHTSTFPGGEIRGLLEIPEPGTAALLGLALAGGLGFRRRRT